MKKLILLLLILSIITTSFAMVANADEWNFDPYEYFEGVEAKDIQKNLDAGEFVGEQDGYVIYNFADNDTYLMDKNGNIPNRLYVIVSIYSDLIHHTICPEGETIDFYGIKVTKINLGINPDLIDAAIESGLTTVSYRIDTPVYYTQEEAAALFAAETDVIESYLCSGIVELPQIDNEETLDPEFADANGFSIYTNPKTQEQYYVTRKGCIPNRITVFSQLEIDVGPYNAGTTDFYGVEVTAVSREVAEFYIDGNGPDIADNVDGNNSLEGFEYTLYTKNYYSDEEAKTLFADYDFFMGSKLVYGLVDGDHGFILGDINGNGIIDSRDYVALKRGYFKTYEFPNETARQKGDINGNGKIDAMDYVYLKRAYFKTYKITNND